MKNQIAQSNFGKCLKLSVVLFLGLMLGTLLPGGGRAFAQSTNSIFGPNVTIISSGTSEANIEAALTNIAGSTYTSNPTGGQFSTNRSAVLFMPGTYTVQAPIGYYTSIAGLGQNPGDVVINGFITPNFGAWSTWCTGNCPQVSLDTYFWRSMENMTINAVADANQGDSVNELQWGVSQGAPLRRMQINGGLELTNTYCGEASGGFTADTQVTATVNSCSQTQWYTRNSSIGSWSSGVWNMVFSGVTGAPTPNYPANSYTVLPTTPVTREKPFLYVDGGGNFWVFSPTLRTNSSSTSWSTSSPGPGNSLAISTFFIATPSSALADINTALAAGQNLILTPGIYQYSGSINVTNPNTVVLGLGYADIVPQTGTPAITVADVDGVQIAGLLIDAGPVNSPILLQVGVAGTDTGVSHASNPTSINDVFFRIGGATVGTATESLEVDSENVILDNIWAWRADHGNTGTTGWTVNTAANGLVVNGANVTALGLAAEHYQQSQVVWNGEGGETVFLESELPYDVPSQAGWMDGAVNGYPAYYVAPTVTTHTTYGLGVYSNFNQGVSIVDTSAISVPNAVGVTATDSVSVFLGGSGSIHHRRRRHAGEFQLRDELCSLLPGHSLHDDLPRSGNESDRDAHLSFGFADSSDCFGMDVGRDDKCRLYDLSRLYAKLHALCRQPVSGWNQQRDHDVYGYFCHQRFRILLRGAVANTRRRCVLECCQRGHTGSGRRDHDGCCGHQRRRSGDCRHVVGG
jgi:hypothetical protein